MTIQSMTAFARSEKQGEWGNLICEIRSINHRYLEAGVFLPESLRALEMPVRDKIKSLLNRGKVECAIRYQTQTGTSASLNLNTALVQELCRVTEAIADFLRHDAPVSPTDLLRYPGVIEPKQADINVLQTEILTLVEATLNQLIVAREREGEELNQLFLKRMDAIQIELVKIRKRLPQIILEQQERIKKRFADIKLDLDPSRLEQEIVIFAQKIDVAEEIERTETHIAEVRRILNEGGVVGRRLDFLLQELNREANTLGSKALDSTVNHAAVEMKVLIEQVREQVQNVE